LECGGLPPLHPSASLLAVISAWRAIPASKLVPPSGKSGGKPPHSKTTDSRSHHQKPMVTITRASCWLAKFSKLRIDRARGDPAPDKPLLLLVLCDLVENASLSHDTLALTPELAFRFYTYWSIVAARRSQRPDVRLLFHHPAGDGVANPSQDTEGVRHLRTGLLFTCSLMASPPAQIVARSAPCQRVTEARIL